MKIDPANVNFNVNETEGSGDRNLGIDNITQTETQRKEKRTDGSGRRNLQTTIVFEEEELDPYFFDQSWLTRGDTPCSPGGEFLQITKRFYECANNFVTEEAWNQYEDDADYECEDPYDGQIRACYCRENYSGEFC